MLHPAGEELKSFMIRFVALAVLIVAAALWYGVSQRGQPPAAAPFQGYVEGETLLIGPVEAERIAHLAVEAGAAVRKDDPLFRMDAALMELQRAEAVARLDQARAQLANLRSALSRPEQIAVLQAGVARAEAALALTQAEFERQSALSDRRIASHAQFDQAKAARDRDAAALAEARRHADAAQLSGRSGDIAAAEAAVAAAEAARRQIETRIARAAVLAPQAGVVQDVFFRAGEMVVAGQPVLSLLPPGARKIRFYAPEPRLAGLAPGARLAVSCDNCPAGLVVRVAFLSKEAEFTPPVIFSEQERAKLVFKAEARFEGDAPPLPLGLPVSLAPAP